jgi:transposase-like protein
MSMERQAHCHGMSKAITSAREKWQRIIQQQRASGLSVAAYCRQNHVPASSLFAWKRRLRAGGVSPAPAFVEAVVRTPVHPPSSSDMMEIRLRGGRRVRVRGGGSFDRQLLIELVAALEALPVVGQAEGVA